MLASAPVLLTLMSREQIMSWHSKSGLSGLLPPVMARKSSLFQSSEPFVALEEVLRWLEEVLKWLEEVLNLPPSF